MILTVRDKYNNDFIRNTDVLFLSGEIISGSKEAFINKLAKKYDKKIIVMGLGKEGVLLYTGEYKKVRKYESDNIIK